MKTNLKVINSYTRQLEITIAWDLIEKDYQNEYMRYIIHWTYFVIPLQGKNLGDYYL